MKNKFIEIVGDDGTSWLINVSHIAAVKEAPEHAQQATYHQIHVNTANFNSPTLIINCDNTFEEIKDMILSEE